jgi:hypothetical protein
MSSERETRQSDATRAPRQPPLNEQGVPEAPPVREEYPGPQETSTGERIDPGQTDVRPDSAEERRGRRRGAS